MRLEEGASRRQWCYGSWSGGLGTGGYIPFLAQNQPEGGDVLWREEEGKSWPPANAVMLRCLLCVKGMEEQFCCCPAHPQHSALPYKRQKSKSLGNFKATWGRLGSFRVRLQLSKREEGFLRLKCCWGLLSPLSGEEGGTGPSGLKMLVADQDPVACVTLCFLFPKLLAPASFLAAPCSSSLAALSSAKESYSEVWVHLPKLCTDASGSVTLQKETSLRETLSFLRRGQQTRKINYQKYCLQKHSLTWICFWSCPVGWLLM